MKELEFPIVFTSCPNCGGKRRIAEIVTNEEIEKGNLEPGQITPFIASKTLIFNPRSLKILIPTKEVMALLGLLDICADCGIVYCIHVQKGKGVIGTAPPAGEVPPSFGKG